MPALLDLSSLKEAFDRDGFVVIRRYLADAELRALTENADSVMEGYDADLETGFRGVRKGLEKSDDWFKQQLACGAHVPLVAAMILDKPSPASAAFFDKPIQESIEIAQHVDGGGKYDGATIWIALDVSDSSNGCLCYVRGSHLKSHRSSELAAFDENSEGAICIEAQPGDAIIHSARTVHWSRKSSSSDRRRRAVSFFYYSGSSLGNDGPGKLGLQDPAVNATCGDIDVAKAKAALQALDRDWARQPSIINMFLEDPRKFLSGLKPKDGEAFNFIVGRLQEPGTGVMGPELA